MNRDNTPWDLREFVEAIADELERVHQVARVKAMQRKRLYTVENMAMSLNVFAEYDGDRVRFRTAQPGENGASQIELKLGSITDKVVTETTQPPPAGEETPIEEIAPAALKPEETRRLRRFGVDSAEDVKRLGSRNVRVDGVDFADLARRMEMATRPRRRPEPARVVRFRRGDAQSFVVFGRHMDEVRPETVRLDGRALPAQATAGALTLDGAPEHAATLEFETLGAERMRLRLG